MLETWVRRYIQPLGNYLVRCIGPVRPDIITGISLIAGIACAGAIAITYHILAVALLWLSGACDMLDGTWARIYGTSSIHGMYADLISDRAVEGAIALALAHAYPDLAWYTTLFVTAILLHFTTFMLAAFIFPHDGEKSIHYEASVIERSEAFIGITAILIFPAYRVVFLSGLSVAILFVAVVRFIRMYHTKT